MATPTDSAERVSDKLPPVVLHKPRYSTPCNHCGLCCRLELCHAARIALPWIKSAPCPALVEVDGKYLCGLVLTEQMAGLKPVLRQTLGIGTGCSMPDDDTTDAEIADFDARAHEMVFGKQNGPATDPQAGSEFTRDRPDGSSRLLVGALRADSSDDRRRPVTRTREARPSNK